MLASLQAAQPLVCKYMHHKSPPQHLLVATNGWENLDEGLDLDAGFIGSTILHSCTLGLHILRLNDDLGGG